MCGNMYLKGFSQICRISPKAMRVCVFGDLGYLLRSFLFLFEAPEVQLICMCPLSDIFLPAVEGNLGPEEDERSLIENISAAPDV